MRLPLDSRTRVMLVVALLAGAVAAWAARQHIQVKVRQLEQQAQVPVVQRVVAAFDLPAGFRLSSDQLAIRSFPASLVPSDSLDPGAHALLEGKVLKTPLRAGDMVLPVHAEAERAQRPFSDRLEQGRRAITMPVDVINSAAGLLQAGDLIDLYVSFEHRRRRITAPLLLGVLVLATGTETGGRDPERGAGAAYSTVTLDTSPEDALKLVAAQQSGHITALLRRTDDDLPTQRATRGDLASLLGVEQSVAPAAGPKRAPVIYGNRPITRLPGLQPSSDSPPVAGLFDLPYMPELVSAWLASRQEVSLGNVLDRGAFDQAIPAVMADGLPASTP